MVRKAADIKSNPKWIPDDLYQTILQVVPRCCADVVVKCGDEVLLLQRRIDPLKGFWALPGGMIYKGEMLAAAAARVARDELGIQVDTTAFRCVGVANFYADMYMRHDICLTYLLELPEKPEIEIDYQHRAYRWFDRKGVIELGEDVDMKVAMQVERAYSAVGNNEIG